MSITITITCIALFLSTLSLRRATWLRCWQLAARDISIHALLAESDLETLAGAFLFPISIHALLAESDPQAIYPSSTPPKISIHALLAESDLSIFVFIILQKIFLSTLSLRRATIDTSKDIIKTTNFYPRSPCGERRSVQHAQINKQDNFYPRSPCGERRRRSVKLFRQNYISIHALLAESDIFVFWTALSRPLFLSTLSLRRATQCRL